jgi:hypothetical protein
MHASDLQAIEALIARQFVSLSWSPLREADWAGFQGDFLSEAALYPAARPVRRQTVEAFVARMQGLREGELRSLHEEVLGTDIRIFGTVAVALAGCAITENGAKTTRGVEMLLLVKSEGEWKIAAQAWDVEGEDKKLPEKLAQPHSSTKR